MNDRPDDLDPMAEQTDNPLADNSMNESEQETPVEELDNRVPETETDVAGAESETEAARSPEAMAMEMMALAVKEGMAPTEFLAEDLATTGAANPAAEDRSRIDPDSLTEDDWQGHSLNVLKPILEAAVFANGKALSLDQMKELFDEAAQPSKKALRYVMQQLMDDYQGRGIELNEVRSGFRFQTSGDSQDHLQRLWEEKPQRYSRALLETLALIAYRQPITRGEIEDVRGVSVSSHIIKTLQEREWVRVVGHRDVPGRPAMYATTREFLDYFNLTSLQDLPSLSEIKDLDQLHPGLDLGEGEEAADGQPNAAETAADETTFDSMIQKLKEEDESHQDNSYIDDELRKEWEDMDQVNRNFEQMLEDQRARLREEELREEEDAEQALNSEESEAGLETEPSDITSEDTDKTDSAAPSLFGQPADAEDQPDLTEEEKIAIIQQKLAQQQALMEDQDEDTQDREDDSDH